MKATYFMGHETFEVRECPIPKAKPGTVVVKNYACGVCGTDVHIYYGEKGSAAVNPPVVLGHEYSGVVTEVGEGVKASRLATTSLSTRTSTAASANTAATAKSRCAATWRLSASR